MLVGKSEKPVASVVVPAYRAKDTIAECLNSLVSQTADLPYEVTVVESSGDGAAGLVREQFPQVQVIESTERLYAGPARNRGAEEASGELLLFVDSDCTAEPEWLSKMWRSHRQWECSAVAGSILNANPETAMSVSCYMNEFSHFFPCGRPRYVDYLPSGNLSYKMEVFRKYGGFDPKETSYEDLIFNKELSRAGEKLLFDPDIKVAHKHRDTLREYLLHELGRGRGAAAARRRGLLIGSSWARYPMLAFLATPGLFLRKATVFPYRLLRADPSSLSRIVRSLPCFYLALLIWHCGFLAEILRDRRDRREKKVVEWTSN